MNIKTGASLGNGRTISVEVSDADGQDSFPDWDTLSTNDKFRKLSAKADSLVVYYLAREHAITKEHAKDRMLVLKQAMA